MSARRITALDVACPSCRATAGQRCRSLDKLKAITPHEPRSRRAKELDRQLHPEHVDGQLPLWGKR